MRSPGGVAFSVLCVSALLWVVVTTADSAIPTSMYQDATALNNARKVLRDRSGILHIVHQSDWGENPNEWKNCRVCYVFNPNSEFPEIKVFECARYPSIALNSDGVTVQVTYACYDHLMDNRIYRWVRHGYNNWSPYAYLNDLTDQHLKLYPCIVIDHDDDVHIVYQFMRLDNNTSSLYHIMVHDAGWGSWCVEDEAQGRWSRENPSCAVDLSNQLNVIYEYVPSPGSFAKIAHKRRPPGFGKWPAYRAIIGPGIHDIGFPSLSQKGDSLHAVFCNLAPYRLEHRSYWTDYGWGDLSTVTSEIVTDGFSEEHYCVWQTPCNFGEIHLSVFNPHTGTWWYHSNISQSPMVNSVWPSAFYRHPLRIGTGYLDVIWTEGNSPPYSIEHRTVLVSPISYIPKTLDDGGLCSNGGRRLVRDENGNLLLVYRSGEGLKATFSWDDGNSWSKPLPLGKGQTPCMSLNSSDEICAIWIDNEEAGPNVQGKLYFSKWLGEGWSPVEELHQCEAPGFGIGAPAMAIGPDDTADVVWLARTQAGAQWADVVYYGSFSTDTIEPEFTYQPIDTVALETSPSPPAYEGACTSISIDLLGRPNIAWVRQGDVYVARKESGGWTPCQNVSNTPVQSALPCMDSYGEFVHVVWQEEVVPEVNEIFHRRRHVSSPNWDPIDNISTSLQTNSVDPVITGGAHVEWSERTGLGYDIFFSDFDEQAMSWSTPGNLSGTPETCSKHPQISFTQDRLSTWVYTCWVEGDSGIYTIATDKRNPQTPFCGPQVGKDTSGRRASKPEPLSSEPNPFNNSAVVTFSVSEPCRVSVKILDCAGRFVRTLLSEDVLAGEHSVRWDRDLLSSGVYFVRLDALGSIQTKKVVIVR
jgi:hypothetical protein